MKNKDNKILFEENKELANFLKDSRLFGHLSDSQLKQLVPLSEFKYYPPNTEILRQGQENDRIYFLIRGEVEILAEGESILSLKRKGDIFGEMSIISSKPCSAAVISKTPATVFSIMAKSIGKYSDLNVDDLYNFLYRVFAMILTEKLTLTTHKAKQFEFTNRLLEETKDSLEQKIEEQKRAEKKRLHLEAQLRHSQKLEAIGTLAGGIAHDFNNLIFAMLGYITMARDGLSDDNPVRDDLEEALIAAKRAKDLIQQILAFSRRQESEAHPIHITPLIKETLKLIRASLPTTIEIQEMIESDCGVIQADPSQIHQVIMNLCTNAGHAMRDSGGTLTVELNETLLDDQFASSHEVKEGNFLILTVSDTGCGIEDTNIERIFDPFFTTKPVGEGTGMGLAVVHGIVKNYNGAITVASNPGEGTIFNVYLPLVNAMTTTAIEEIKVMSKGSERLLIIDDEESLVKLEKRILEQCGYQVTSSTDSFEAIALFRKRPDQFDLVVTDQTMPKLTGAKMAQEMLRIRPDIKIVLVTGFSKAFSPQQAKAIGIDSYIMKPIDPHSFSKTIRRVLDS
ncbi:MAG: response regulator [Proteobacteria bacterium]|nr:response regulator [Pseudomonadota bacterium]